LESLQVSQPYKRAAQIKVLLSIWLSVIAISEYYASLARISLLWMCESSLLSSTVKDLKYTKLLTSSVLCPPIFKPLPVLNSERDIIKALVLLILKGCPISTAASLSS
jgi:uncharacterized membrane protein